MLGLNQGSGSFKRFPEPTVSVSFRERRFAAETRSHDFSEPTDWRAALAELLTSLGVQLWEMRLLAFCLFMLLRPAFGQEKSGLPRLPSPLIDHTKPSVYLTYKKSETLTSRYSKEPVNLIWLELRNNTRWLIGHVSGGDEFGSGWCYQLRTNNRCRYPVGGNCGDVGGPVEIEPGQSVLIAVSSYELNSHLEIETKFRFPWEKVGDVEHSLRFGYSKLPLDVRKTIPSIEVMAALRPSCYLENEPTPATVALRPIVKLPLPAPPAILDWMLSPPTVPGPPTNAPTNPKKK